MLRFLIIILTAAMAVPVVTWASPSMPGGVELIGPTCCRSQSYFDSTPNQSKVEKACCCGPSTIPAGIGNPKIEPSTPDKHQSPVPMLAVITDLPQLVATHISSNYQSARGPPSGQSLLAQRTSLLL